ncbi:hypothetical protein IW261DRAFT_1573411 [Armillaria novae-zelandiae]|uniref:Uncharacterized protein n=1 Tax=Armillaria novae-zelandiae TaxID=153914 RepID=A0AA39TSE7_9AGAR|nr:hypothetical protein IW261DRAFT_1573411 [Armillaria novae-zelandiae]
MAYEDSYPDGQFDGGHPFDSFDVEDPPGCTADLQSLIFVQVVVEDAIPLLELGLFFSSNRVLHHQ